MQDETEILQKWVVFDPLCRGMAAKMTKKKPLDAYQAVSVLTNPVDIDTVDDAPERVQRRMHCTRVSPSPL